MAGRKTFLHYLEELWEEAGLAAAEFPDIRTESPLAVIEAIQERINYRGTAGSRLVDPTVAQRVEQALSVIRPELARITPRSSGVRDYSRVYGRTPRNVDRLARSGVTPFAEIPSRTITAADMPPLPANFWERYTQLDTNLERALRARRGAEYVHDPFYMRFGHLTAAERQPFLDELSDLMGVNHLLDRGFGPEMFKPIISPWTGEINRAPAGRFTFSPDALDDPRAMFLSRFTLQYNMSNIGNVEYMADLYRPSGRMLRPQVIQHQQQLREQIQSGGLTGRITILDVETPGLRPEEGIWQHAFQTIEMREGRAVGTAPDVVSANITNPFMDWKGRIGREAQPLSGFLSPGGTEEYVAGMMPLLRAVEQSDYVAGHNVFFDYGMISRGLTKHAAYHEGTAAFDPEFRRLADIFISKFEAGAGQIGPVIDTHYMASYLYSERMRHNIAPELAGLDSPQGFSLQNLLLQSDLWERVTTAHPELAEELLREGTHSARVDVAIERHLTQAIVEELAGTGPGLDLTKRLTDEVARNKFLRSKAVGPLINMSDFAEHIDDRLVERLLTASMGDSPVVTFDDKALRELGFQGGALDAIERVHHDAAYVGYKKAFEDAGLNSAVRQIKLNPVEQQVLLGRRYIPSTVGEIPLHPSDPSRWATLRDKDLSLKTRLRRAFWDPPNTDRSLGRLDYHAGMWDRESAPFVSRTTGLLKGFTGDFPSDEMWAAAQQRFADAGLPFAGSHWIERYVMAELGQTPPVAHGLPGEEIIRSALGAEVAPIGRFTAAEQLTVFPVGTSGRMVAIPEWMLIEAEQAQVFHTAEGVARTGFAAAREADPTRLQLYALSPFEYSPGRYDMGVMFRFGAGDQGVSERRRLLEYIEARVEAGAEGFSHIDDNILASLREAIMGETSRYGIQVGTFGRTAEGFQQKGAAKRIHDVIATMFGEVDRENPQIWVAHVPSTDRRVLRTTDAILRPELLSEAEEAARARSGRLASNPYEEALAHGRKLGSVARFRKLAGQGQDMSAAFRWTDTYETVAKRAPVFAAGTALLGGAYYLHKRNQRDKLVDQTMAYQESEEEGWYEGYRSQLGTFGIENINSPRRTTNPLSTAGLTKKLDERKTAHQYMGKDKYSYLFGGGYS